jgi:predicted metal-dependent peptidase
MKETLPEIRRARLNLMLAHPFLAQAVARYEFVESPRGCFDTMATDGFYIYYDRRFVASIDHEQLIGVIAHEVLHCILGHLDRRGSRHPEIWNEAIDFATNLFLIDQGFSLPAGLYDRAYLGMTAEDIYERLVQNPQSRPSRIRGMQGLGSGGMQQHPYAGSSQDQGNPRTEPPSADKSRQPAGGTGFDIHLDADDPRLPAIRGSDLPSLDERRQIRAGLAEEMASHLMGKAAGLWKEEIRFGTKRPFEWRELLSHFFNGLRMSDYRMMPPNKKHLWRGIYLPSVGVPGPERIVVAIDTSGSMDRALLGDILQELDHLRSTAECELVLIQCDTAIQEVKTYDCFELSSLDLHRFQAMGRGGTDFTPVFQWIEHNLSAFGKAVDALIYFTDGYGRFPHLSPNHPVLWILPKSGSNSIPFGMVLRM